MKVYDSLNIRNVAIIGHAGSGKTTFAEAMLFEAGMINRRGTIEEKNTVSDNSEIEQDRGNSIFTTLMHIEWKDTKINILDTPGYADFIGEVISSLKVVDTALIILNAQHGVEVGTEIGWEYVKKYNTPSIFIVNQLDNEKAEFDKTVEQAKATFGANVVIVQYPLNQGDGFDAIVDVLNMVMYKYPAGGGKPEKVDIPDDQKERAEQLHNDLVESIAVNDEKLMELFFEKGTLSEEEMTAGLKAALLNHDIYPVFCASSKQNMGAGRVMGFISKVVPAPTEMPEQELEGEGTLKLDPNGSTTLFVFKSISEPHLGDMSIFKVCAGKVKIGDDFVNEERRENERINQLFLMDGKKRVNIDQLHAGDIGATVKLKNTYSNNTLHIKGPSIAIKHIEYPEPIMSVGIVAEAKGEEEKLSTALSHLKREDPTLIVEQSQELRQTLLHGQGEMHLAIAKTKLDQVYGVKVAYEDPKISYRETIHKSAKATFRHKKQSGGAGQFAEVHMMVEPWHEGMADPPDFNVRNTEEIDLDWGGKLVFLNCIVGGAIDNKYMNAIVKGLLEKMADSPLTGYYVRDVRVSVYDGKMHPVDSNDISFKLASIRAFKDAFLQADPRVMEPIYDVEVSIPDDLMGDVMSDLQTRRAIISGTEAEGANQKIMAKVPLAELHKYSSALRSIAQGRAKYSRKFAEYAMVPMEVQKKLMRTDEEELQEA
ncbi:MAG: elongation factor G [Bacteroidetes bacterium]|nr:elongation factor G [Bacteroidota bacterium]